MRKSNAITFTKQEKERKHTNRPTHPLVQRRELPCECNESLLGDHAPYCGNQGSKAASGHKGEATEELFVKGVHLQRQIKLNAKGPTLTPVEGLY